MLPVEITWRRLARFPPLRRVAVKDCWGEDVRFMQIITGDAGFGSRRLTSQTAPFSASRPGVEISVKNGTDSAFIC